jgi:hypothetical protein
VDPTASVVVVGPKQLANRHAVDEITIYRARQCVFMKRVQATAETIAIEDPKGFDWKMQVLREIRPDQQAAIQALSDQLRINWRTALAFERELDETVPTLHRALEDDRREILTRVSEVMVASSEPWTQLARADDIAREIIGRDFERLYGPLVPQVSSGEIARLIGECPVGWQKRQEAHA